MLNENNGKRSNVMFNLFKGKRNKVSAGVFKEERNKGVFNLINNNRGQIGQILVVIVLIILSVLAIVKYIVPMFNKADELSGIGKDQIDSVAFSIRNQVAGADNVIVNGGEARNTVVQFMNNQDVVVTVTTKNATGSATTTISYVSSTSASNATGSTHATGVLAVGYTAGEDPDAAGYINPSARFLKKIYYRANNTLEAITLVQQ